MLLWTKATWKMQTARGHQAAKHADQRSAPALPACTQPCSGCRGVSEVPSYLPIPSAGGMFAVYSSNIWRLFDPASCARADSVHGHGGCSLPGKALLTLSSVGIEPCGTKLSWRKEQRRGISTFEKLFLCVRKQKMILLVLPVLFIALF